MPRASVRSLLYQGSSFSLVVVLGPLRAKKRLRKRVRRGRKQCASTTVHCTRAPRQLFPAARGWTETRPLRPEHEQGPAH